MKTIQIELPTEIAQQLEMLSESQGDFILKAIQEKIDKQKKEQILIEGYQANYQEDKEMIADFEFLDLENWS